MNGYVGCLLVNCFIFRGESPGCRLFSTASMLEWLRKLLPTRGTVQKDGAEMPWGWSLPVFYVLRGFLTSPFIFNDSVVTAAPFNVVNHPCSELRNESLKKFWPLAGIKSVILGTKRRSSISWYIYIYIYIYLPWNDTHLSRSEPTLGIMTNSNALKRAGLEVDLMLCHTAVYS